jgi:GT2 family glycosyltransferase
MISVCVAVYKAHPAPNLATLGGALADALSGEVAELCVALNGIGAAEADVPDFALTKPLAVNMGVAPGWNAAATLAGGDILIFANDDCEPGADSFAALARTLRDDAAIGVAGPVGSNWDRTSWEHREFVHPAPGDVADCDVVSGFCFATRRETFDQIGGFDEFYAPASWEEVDYNAAVHAAGLRSVAVGVEIAHEWGVSAKQPPWRRIEHNGRKELLRSIHRRNRKHFLEKWS